MDDWSMKPLLAVLLSLVVSLAMWMVYREGVKAGRDEAAHRIRALPLQRQQGRVHRHRHPVLGVL